MSRELDLLAKTIPHMNQRQKSQLTDKTLQGIRQQTEIAYREGKDLEQILQPAYDDQSFMNVLGLLEINREKLKELVIGYIESEKSIQSKKDVMTDIAEDKASFGLNAKEALEISRKGARLTFLRKAPFLVSKEKIWDEYNKFINSLEQRTFDNHIVEIIQMLHYGHESCSEFENAEKQTDNTIRRWPRLGNYRGALLEWIKQNRSENGFKE